MEKRSFKNFDIFMNAHIDAYMEDIINDNEYKKLSNHIVKTISKLKQSLNQEQWKLFLEYESNNSNLDLKILYLIFSYIDKKIF